MHRPHTTLLLCRMQYIVKPPRTEASAFRWHRDCDWLAADTIITQPYLSVRYACGACQMVSDVLHPDQERSRAGVVRAG